MQKSDIRKKASTILLGISSISWVVTVFGIKAEWKFVGGNRMLTDVILFLFPIFLMILTLLALPKNDEDEIIKCESCELVDSNFLPVYLGYFFVALSMPDEITLLFLTLLLYMFIMLTSAQFFNPTLLLFGYHFYNVVTSSGTKLFLIRKGKVIRRVGDITNEKLLRINDSTYIHRGGNK